MLLKAVGKEGAAKKGMQFGFVCKPGALCVSINGKDAGTIKRLVSPLPPPLSSRVSDMPIFAVVVRKSRQTSYPNKVYPGVFRGHCRCSALVYGHPPHSLARDDKV